MGEVKYSNISALRIDLYDCKKSPGHYLQPYLPEKSINRSWIPQTLGYQIWALFEFPSKADRIEWEESLPNNIKKWLDRNLIEKAIPLGWYSRDMNGFIVYNK